MELKYNIKLEDFNPKKKQFVETTLREYEEEYQGLMALPQTHPAYKHRERRIQEVQRQMSFLRYYLEVYDDAIEERKNTKVVSLYPRGDAVVEARLSEENSSAQ